MSGFGQGFDFERLGNGILSFVFRFFLGGGAWQVASGCDVGVFVCFDIAETLADMLVLKFSRTKDCLLVLRETSFTSIATILASGCADLDIDHHVVSLPFTRLTGQPDDIVEAQRIMHIASSFLCEKHRKRTWAAG